MRMNGYPDSMIVRADPPILHDQVEENVKEDTLVDKDCVEGAVNDSRKIRKMYPVISPYIIRKNIFRKYEVLACFNPSSTRRKLLAQPNDKVIKESVIRLVSESPVKIVMPLT